MLHVALIAAGVAFVPALVLFAAAWAQRDPDGDRRQAYRLQGGGAIWLILAGLAAIPIGAYLWLVGHVVNGVCDTAPCDNPTWPFGALMVVGLVVAVLGFCLLPTPAKAGDESVGESRPEPTGIPPAST